MFAKIFVLEKLEEKHLKKAKFDFREYPAALINA
jgi:hypothetical protein